MKSNELRIGNYIFLGEEKELKKVNSHVISFMDISEKRGDLIPFNPISISEEWLLKFKFKYQDRDVNRSDGKKVRFYISPNFGKGVDYHLELCLDDINFSKCIWLHWDVGGGNQFIYLQNTPEFIHQIQNLYHSLSGEDLVCA